MFILKSYVVPADPRVTTVAGIVAWIARFAPVRLVHLHQPAQPDSEIRYPRGPGVGGKGGASVVARQEQPSRAVGARAALPKPDIAPRGISLLVTALVLLGAIRSEVQPANDMFQNAQVVVPTWNSNMTETAGSITVPRPAWIYNGEANLVGATLEPGEPNHAGANGIASVWFTYTAPAAGS